MMGWQCPHCGTVLPDDSVIPSPFTESDVAAAVEAMRAKCEAIARDKCRQMHEAASHDSDDGDDYDAHGCLEQSICAGQIADDIVALKEPRRPRFRHNKRGSTVEIEGEAELQSAGGAIEEGAQLVVYRHLEDGKLWARPSSEFHDGRFAALKEPNSE